LLLRTKVLLVQGVEEDADHTDEPAPIYVLLFDRRRNKKEIKLILDLGGKGSAYLTLGGEATGRANSLRFVSLLEVACQGGCLAWILH
jgi:hypothetical protein